MWFADKSLSAMSVKVLLEHSAIEGDSPVKPIVVGNKGFDS